MTTHTTGAVVGLYHHRHRIPADIGKQFALHRLITGKALLMAHRNGIHIGGIGAVGKIDPRATCTVHHLLNQIVGAISPFKLNHRLQRLEPLLCLLWIVIDSFSHLLFTSLNNLCLTLGRRALYPDKTSVRSGFFNINY